MTANTINQLRWTVTDLDGLPENGNRYEIIDGDLNVTRAPHWQHQNVAGRVYAQLLVWSNQTGLGEPAIAPGVIFSTDNAVIPDVVWASYERLDTSLDEAGHLTGAPELMVEVLSQTPKDKDRDRNTKLKLYSNEGVSEYWICDRERQSVEIFRRHQGVLAKAMTLYAEDTLTSPLLPGFTCEIKTFFS